MKVTSSARSPATRSSLGVTRAGHAQSLAAAAASDEPGGLEAADGFAHRRAVDVELAREFRLGGEEVARLQAALQDLLLDGGGDAAIGRLGDQRFEQAVVGGLAGCTWHLTDHPIVGQYTAQRQDGKRRR
jgi:hypothetical protein